VNFSLRKLIKNRASLPTDEAAIKLRYLGLRNIAQRWTMPIQNWKQAMSQLMIRFEQRFNPAWQNLNTQNSGWPLFKKQPWSVPDCSIPTKVGLPHSDP